MRRHAVSAVFATWLALFTGPAAALTCGVEFSRDGDFVIIQSFAQSDRAATVNYMVRTETRSASGVSLSQQGGKVAAPGGSAQAPLARSIINNRPNATVVVDVKVRADGETASCTAEKAMRDDQEL